ncbi:chromophore lyase CpcT/CpeT [Flavobacteriaceae bacterium M23B6Z8]
MMKSIIHYGICFSVIILMTVSSCKKESQTKETTVQEDPIEELFSLMQGSFNSEAQSIADSTYFNISLHMYPIWKDKGYWLYVEQALNEKQDQPYRQRIYELNKENDSVFTSTIYTLPNDSLYVGKWKDPSFFDNLPIDSILERKGCEVYLRRIGDTIYTGATKPKSCESSLRGASYATSDVAIYPGKIVSWDRGFDTEGNQVWGAEKGGYIFLKVSE